MDFQADIEAVGPNQSRFRLTNPWKHLPPHLQDEVMSLLRRLEFDHVDQITELQFKTVQEQFKKLAKKYHPDATEQKLLDQETIDHYHEKFIMLKEAYDRMIELNQEKTGKLFMENILEEDEKQKRLDRIKKVAMAREAESSFKR